MDIIKQILINYWHIILAAFLLLISFILRCVQKKPISDITSDIFTFSLTAISEVEASGLTGSSNKLHAAIGKVCGYLKNKYPDLSTSPYVVLIMKTIEAILSTPQKHEIKK